MNSQLYGMIPCFRTVVPWPAILDILRLLRLKPPMTASGREKDNLSRRRLRKDTVQWVSKFMGGDKWLVRRKTRDGEDWGDYDARIEPTLDDFHTL